MFPRRATRPSIISEGAMISAPACASVTLIFARRGRVSSFKICSPSTKPQCPCEVYSQRQTSATTSREGYFFLIWRMALCVMPSGAYACEPTASFSLGIPKISTPAMPLAATSASISSMRSTEYWNTPGIEGIGFLIFSPSITKMG